MDDFSYTVKPTRRTNSAENSARRLFATETRSVEENVIIDVLRTHVELLGRRYLRSLRLMIGYGS